MKGIKIQSIVLTFKEIAKHSTTELQDGIATTFHKLLDDLLPSRFYALYQEGDEWEIEIFNSAKARKRWAKETEKLIDDWNGENLTGEKISYQIITFEDFLRLSSDKRYNLNYYLPGLDFNDTIAFCPFYSHA